MARAHRTPSTWQSRRSNAGDSSYKIEIVNGGKVADDAKDAKQAMNAYNKVMADSPEAIVELLLVGHTAHGRTGLKDGMLLATGATNADVTFKRRSLTVPTCWKPAPSRFPAMRRSC